MRSNGFNMNKWGKRCGTKECDESGVKDRVLGVKY